MPPIAKLLWPLLLFIVNVHKCNLGENGLFLCQNGEVHNYQFKLITIDRVFTFAADDRSM